MVRLRDLRPSVRLGELIQSEKSQTVELSHGSHFQEDLVKISFSFLVMEVFLLLKRGRKNEAGQLESLV